MRFLRTLTATVLGSALLVGPAFAQESARTIDDLLEDAIKGSRESREIDQKREAEFRANKAEQARLLRDMEARRTRLEARSDELEKLFSENEILIANLEDLLRNRLGSLGELFGVVRQVAGETRGVVDSSLISAQHPGRGDALTPIATSKKLPKIDALRFVWQTLLQEMIESGKVVKFPSTVVLPTGEQVEREVTRVGPFVATSEGKFLRFVAETGKLTELPRQPPDRHLSAAEDLEEASAGELVAMSVDPSRGSILALLIESPTFAERIGQGGTVGVIIISLGAIGIAITIWRFIYLMGVDRRMRAQRGSSTANDDNPLGRVIGVWEANKEADTETLELKLDEAILRETPKLESQITTIKVLSVIAPLLGLLGTVTGMIETFQQITLFGTGDPKLMAGGISQALVTTMLGLIMAIPLTLLHSILRDRSKALVQVIEEESAGLIAQQAEEERAA